MKLIQSLLVAVFICFAAPAYSYLSVYQVKEGDSGVIPHAVWIACDGVPVFLVTSTSYGLLVGDVFQIDEYLKPGTDSNALLHGAMDEAVANNTLAMINLSDRTWIDCKVNVQPVSK